MTDKILFVDDDENLLNSYYRNLKKEFNVNIALGGEEGLNKIKENGPYAVIIADMKMPGMDGIQFLSKVKTISSYTVRMMLTGNSELHTAINAINEGAIFRFMTKPCPLEILKNMLISGLEQYRLIMSEKILIEQTLRGSIKILTDVLSMAKPRAFSKSTRILHIVKNIIKELNIKNKIQIEMAVMFSQIGVIAIPENIIEKVYQGRLLTESESEQYSLCPKIGHDLLANIPKLEHIAKIIQYQEKHFDGQGAPKDKIKGDAIPLGSRILKIVLDYDNLITSGLSSEKASIEIKSRRGYYDPKLVDVFIDIISKSIDANIIESTIKNLKKGMILFEDIVAEDGTLLLSKGQELSSCLIYRIFTYNNNVKIHEPIKVFY